MTADGLDKELPHEVTKLTLNLTYRALERLVGGNTELEIQLRRSAVERFFKHYIKSIVNSLEFKTFEQDICRMYREEINQKIGTIQGCGWAKPKLTLNKEFKKRLVELINKQVDNIILQTLASLDIEKRMTELVNYKVGFMEKLQPLIDSTTSKEVDRRVLERLNKAASL